MWYVVNAVFQSFVASETSNKQIDEDITFTKYFYIFKND